MNYLRFLFVLQKHVCFLFNLELITVERLFVLITYLCSARQHHAHLHLVQCVWRESRLAEGLLQHHPSSQQQQGTGGAYATANRVSG